MRNVLLLIHVISIFQNINSSNKTSLEEKVKREWKKSNFKWTSELEAELADIYRNTSPDKPYHFDRIKKEWRNTHPEYDGTDSSLYKRVLGVSEKYSARGKRPKNTFTWDDENYGELADIYLKTYPYNKTHPLKIEDEWARRHPECPKYNSSYLSSRARKYLEKRPLRNEAESSKRFFEWTNRHDSDLYHIYHVTLPEGKSQPVHMHRMWIDLHPDLRDLTHDQMIERMDYLRKNPPDEHFPWISQQNQELLRIYHNTDPNKANQEQRIYKIWSKIHPRYSFMTPYYLQVHASTLAHHEEMKGKERRKNRIFTDEQKANLVDMYRRLAKRHQPLYDFHKMWVSEYPSLAHLTPLNLAYRAKRLTSKDTSFNAEVTEGKQPFENPLSTHRKYHKYTPEQRAELLDIFRQSSPQEYKHNRRLHDKCILKNENSVGIKGDSLKTMIRKWIEKDLDKKGKGPMVIPKDEVRSESSPSASEE